MSVVGSTTIVGVEVEIHAEKSGKWSILKGGELVARGRDLEKAERSAATALRKRGLRRKDGDQ